MRLPSSILLTCLCLSAATTARAQAPLRAYVAAEVPVAAEAVRAGLARDLGRPVELVDAATAELAIRMAGGEAELRYDADGGARTRAVTLPTDRDDATATLVLIAANLVRDPTEQLVAPAATPTPPAPVAGPPPLAAPPIATGEKPAPANLALARPFQLGLGILGGAASTASGVQGYWYLGMDILGTIAPGVRLGVTRLSVGLGFSNVESFIFSLQGTPTLELFAFVDPRVQVYGQDSPSSTNAPSPPDERSTAQARTDDDLAAALRALESASPRRRRRSARLRAGPSHPLRWWVARAGAAGVGPIPLAVPTRTLRPRGALQPGRLAAPTPSRRRGASRAHAFRERCLRRSPCSRRPRAPRRARRGPAPPLSMRPRTSGCSPRGRQMLDDARSRLAASTDHEGRCPPAARGVERRRMAMPAGCSARGTSTPGHARGLLGAWTLDAWRCPRAARRVDARRRAMPSRCSARGPSTPGHARGLLGAWNVDAGPCPRAARRVERRRMAMPSGCSARGRSTPGDARGLLGAWNVDAWRCPRAARRVDRRRMAMPSGCSGRGRSTPGHARGLLGAWTVDACFVDGADDDTDAEGVSSRRGAW